MNDEIRANAMLQEMAQQRMLLGDRAVNLAGEVSELKAEIEKLRAKIAELMKPKDA